MRKQMGLSQRELARLIGEQSQTNIVRFETGARHPSFETLIALSCVLNTPIQKLFPEVIDEVEKSCLANIKALIAELNLEASGSQRDLKLRQLGIVLEELELRRNNRMND
jgi:transcriptional regulator with XRE-family HTH domain